MTMLSIIESALDEMQEIHDCSSKTIKDLISNVSRLKQEIREKDQIICDLKETVSKNKGM